MGDTYEQDSNLVKHNNIINFPFACKYTLFFIQRLGENRYNKVNNILFQN